MNIESKDYFDIVYAKNMCIPKNKRLSSRIDLVRFFLENLNDIDFLSVNEVNIDIIKLVNTNKNLSRYLKLKRI